MNIIYAFKHIYAYLMQCMHKTKQKNELVLLLCEKWKKKSLYIENDLWYIIYTMHLLNESI